LAASVDLLFRDKKSANVVEVDQRSVLCHHRNNSPLPAVARR
jgi:hypothetical protein